VNAAGSSRRAPVVRRSVLIVPANVERFTARAADRGADAVMLDLEDSIPLDQKDAARGSVMTYIARIAGRGYEVLVRVNSDFPSLIADLDVAVSPGVDAIGLPKVESARDVIVADALIAEREVRRGLARGAIGLAVVIESARALGALDEILGASERIETVELGIEDLCVDLGIAPSRDGTELRPSQHALILAARRAAVEPLGMASTLAHYDDAAATLHSIAIARDLGFRGASCIHPSQIPPLNEIFSPSSEQIAHAHRVIATDAEARRVGRGSASLAGMMIDAPVVKRAERLLARADLIARRTRPT